LGLASAYLGLGVTAEDEVPVYIQPTKHFHMPADDKNIIMVGPGTGIAPFRAFIEERALNGATGKNWLYFGDQKRASDFLYEEEFKNYLDKGVLSKLDTAFSRELAAKRGLFLRLRRCQAHGQGRSPDFDRYCSDARKHEPGSSEGIYRDHADENRKALSKRRLLGRKRAGFCCANWCFGSILAVSYP
jgi:hypothetical protein